MDHLLYLLSCVGEMYHSEFLVFLINILQDYTIPAGNMLMLSPYWAHRNPVYFPQPESFNPVRIYRILQSGKNIQNPSIR